MDEQFEVLIVGAGPSGISAAITLAGSGNEMFRGRKKKDQLDCPRKLVWVTDLRMGVRD